MKEICNSVEVFFITTSKDPFQSFILGDLIIVHENLSNGWLRGSLHFDLPGTTYRPTGIFPSTFVTLVTPTSNSINQNGIVN